MIVQSVNQTNKSPGLGPVLLTQDGNVPDDDSVEHLGHLQVVVRPQRSGAQLFKLAVQDASAVFFKVNIPTFDPDGDWSHIVRLLGCHELEDGIETFLGRVLRVPRVEK